MENKIFILSGPVHSGKTTRLREWVDKNVHAGGVLTPVVENKRKFYDIRKREFFPMDALPEEKEVLTIGKYIFSMDSFTKAEKIIEEAMKNSKWIVIDEIGPLELKGQGFSRILKKILSIEIRNFNLLLVIRDSILKEVLDYFTLGEYDSFLAEDS